MARETLPAKRRENALGTLQEAQSALKLAAEELAIADAEMIGSDAHRRLIVESSAAKPIETADDITSHRTPAAELAQFAADVGKLAKQVKGKAAFIGQALGSVYSAELLEGDRAQERKNDKPKRLFPDGSKDDR